MSKAAPLLKIGDTAIDLEAYAIAGNAILGIRDSGKTYSATMLAEQLHEAGIPFVAFDPIGVWRFLRVPGTGKTAKGFPVVVAGGEDGDLPLTVASAPEILRAALASGVSLVIDLFDKRLSKADWRRIVTDCALLLLHDNKPHGLRHVFLEEAPEFVPQRTSPDQARAYEAVERLARMGGNSRLGLTLIGQRSAEISKAVLELCDNLFLHRQKGRNSLVALEKWLDVGNVKDSKAVMDTLATLPTGECWAWLGQSDQPIRLKMPAKRSAHPDRRALRDDKVLAKKAVNVSAFVDTMRGSLAKYEEEAKANDPRALKAKIGELERLGGKADPAALKAEYERGKGDAEMANEAALKRAFAAGYKTAADAIVPVARAMDEGRVALGKVIETASKQDHAAINGLGPLPILNARPATRQEERRVLPDPTLLRGTLAGDTTLGGPERKILTALAQHGACEKTRLALLTGYSHNGGAFNNPLGRLRSAGYIDRGWPAQITRQGLDALGAYDRLPTGRALIDHWMASIDAPMQKILRPLVNVWPSGLDKESLAAAAGYEANGGAFNNPLGRLRTLGLVDRGWPAKASKELMES